MDRLVQQQKKLQRTITVCQRDLENAHKKIPVIQTDLKEEEHRFKAQSEQLTEWMGTVEKELDQKHENQLATKEKKHEVELNLRKLNKDFEQAA